MPSPAPSWPWCLIACRHNQADQCTPTHLLHAPAAVQPPPSCPCCLIACKQGKPNINNLLAPKVGDAIAACFMPLCIQLLHVAKIYAEKDKEAHPLVQVSCPAVAPPLEGLVASLAQALCVIFRRALRSTSCRCGSSCSNTSGGPACVEHSGFCHSLASTWDPYCMRVHVCDGTCLRNAP